MEISKKKHIDNNARVCVGAVVFFSMAVRHHYNGEQRLFVVPDIDRFDGH